MAIVLKFCISSTSKIVFTSVVLLFSLYYCSVMPVYGQENAGLTNQTKYSEQRQQLGDPALSIKTDREVYGEGDNVGISGYVYNGTDFPMNEKVKITIENIPSGEITDNASVVTAADGSYNHTVSNTEDGNFKATALVNINDIKETASTTFQIKSIFWTTPAIMLYVGASFFIALMAVIFFGRKITEGIEKEGEKIFLVEILRFICLTGIAVSFIVSLIFSEVEVGANAPIGLIIKDPSEGLETGEGAADSDVEGSQWMINVGGSAADNYAGGIQIPVTVLIFGVAGGYLRYLYGLRYLYEKKIYDGQPEHTEREWGDINIDDKLALFKHSLRSLSLFFLSPLLAIAVWFVVFQGGITAKYSIAAMSFTLGLVTEEVIQALIAFARSILGGIRGTAGLGAGAAIATSAERAPTVLNTIPNDKSTAVAVNTPIKATFSETMDKSSINNYTVTLKDSNNKTIVVVVDLSEDGRTVTLTPKTSLSPSSNYIATISHNVKDLSGTTMAKDKTWSFGTA